MTMVRLAEYAVKGADGKYAALARHSLIQNTILSAKNISTIVRKPNMVIVVLDGFPLQFDSDDAEELDDMVNFFYQIRLRFGD